VTKVDRFEGPFRFLSNFYLSPVGYLGVEFPSAENAYQAAKSTDRETQLGFLSMTPGQAKRAGMKVALRADWESVKLSVMEDVVREKFRRKHLADMLLSTGGVELVEGNTWGDRFWGVCRGKGENHLGRILMKVRDELRVGP
jgi:ribA/ribD-fused uncharacterized protein